MVFATWFGAEAVLGGPARFLEKGLGGLLAVAVWMVIGSLATRRSTRHAAHHAG